MKRDIWMTSLNNFRNCKMRTVQILLLRLCLFSLMILRSSSTIWPELCEYCYLCGWFWKKVCLLPLFLDKRKCFTNRKRVIFFFYCVCREQKVVDFKQVDAHVHQFKGSSARYLRVFSVTLYLFIAASVLILWFLEETETGPAYGGKLRLTRVENMVLYLLYLYIYLLCFEVFDYIYLSYV